MSITPAETSEPPDLTVEDVTDALSRHGYLADEGLATSIFLAMALRRPLLLEGEAGVRQDRGGQGAGSAWTGGELLRLQCYEGIDVSQAVYEWDYARQLLHLRAAEGTVGPVAEGGGVQRAVPRAPAAAHRHRQVAPASRRSC